MRRFALAVALALTMPAAVLAQSPYLVKDINTTTNSTPSSSYPFGFFGFGGRVYFGAAQGNLWSTDGTSAGTTLMVRNVLKSPQSLPFIDVNGHLVFNGFDSAHGTELWVSDGTPGGTRLLADINSGAASSFPGDRIVYHGQMLFAADDGVDGNELWVTDGTSVGTHFFKDLKPGSSGSDPHSFVIFNDLVYFVAAGSLWKSDGTRDGTVAVTAVTAGNLTVSGGKLFFVGYTPDTGTEPWISDGTAAGTRMIADLWPGSSSSVQYSTALTPFGDRILFSASEPQHGAELWISDGTASGTHVVADVNPGPGNGVLPQTIAVAGNAAYFTAFESSPTQVWKTDGTEAGTMRVSPDVKDPRGFAAVGSQMFFVATSGSTRTLFVTDGTAAGTRQVKTSSPLTLSGYPTTVGGTVYFSGANLLNGSEPWKSDGTDAGTVMVANLAADAAPSSSPQDLIAAGNGVFFSAWDGLTPALNGDFPPLSLWHSDGTDAGTIEILDRPVSSGVAVGNSLFFSMPDGEWVSDGTARGTVPATELRSRFAGQATVIDALGGTLLVNVNGTSTTQPQLWATNVAPGSPAVALGPTVGAFAEIAGRVFYFANDALRTTDGTVAGSHAVAPIGGASAFVPAGGALYFPMGTKLWKSDGTYGGTSVVKDFSPSQPFDFVPGDTRLYFRVNGQLWVTDGSDAVRIAAAESRLDVGNERRPLRRPVGHPKFILVRRIGRREVRDTVRSPQRASSRSPRTRRSSRA